MKKMDHRDHKTARLSVRIKEKLYPRRKANLETDKPSSRPNPGPE